MSSTTTNARKPLTLKKPVANTLDGSTIVKAKRSPQRHVLPKGKTVTLCRIDTGKWAAKDEATETTVTCPLCAEGLKAEALKAEAKKATA
jgi:hypothetical protein